MLALTNQVPPFQDFEMVLDGRHTEPGLAGNGLQTGPAIAFASGTAYEIGMGYELDWRQSKIKAIIGEARKTYGGGEIVSERNRTA